jgi:Trypsin-like peptidase domain
MRYSHVAAVLMLLTASAAATMAQEMQNPPATSTQEVYIITAHTSTSTDRYSNVRDELYTVTHGAEILQVKYSSSQTSSAKPGDFPGSGLHPHFSYLDPDLSQIPAVGVAIRECLMSKNRDRHGDLVIDTQPTPQPCMARVGSVLQYEPSPNAGDFTYVAFDILTERIIPSAQQVNGLSARAILKPIPAAAKASPTPSRRDIPTIAKAADQAIVTIVMKDGDKPIARGTGFLVRTDGVIVTNYHVIEEGNHATVKFPDGTVFPVDGVLQADKVRDLAVIKIHGKTFRTLTLGNSDQIQIGEEVVAIGNPLSLESTVSNGIVSGMRTAEKLGGKFLQTTAPISPGSSGGPLFNMFGEVVGINTMYLEGGENLNFAIPVNDAKRLLLNQSAKLQDLPNEAPPAEQAEPRPAGTLEQQAACSQQSEHLFAKIYTPNVFDNLQESHFDASSGVCYMIVTGPRSSSDQKDLQWIYQRSIKDAFGGQVVGLFNQLVMYSDGEKRIPEKRLPPFCMIHPPGQPEIMCSSEDEYNVLALKYFGIGQ